MQRPVQVGDGVRLILRDIPDTYEITDIQGARIYIQDVYTKEGLSLIPYNGVYEVAGHANEPYVIEFFPKPDFNGDYEHDIAELVAMPDAMLDYVCDFGVYARNLCNRYDLWDLKIASTFGKDVLDAYYESPSGSIVQYYYDLVSKAE